MTECIIDSIYNDADTCFISYRIFEGNLNVKGEKYYNLFKKYGRNEV